MGCERLVHPSVDGAGQRHRLGRLIGLLFGAPFLLAGAVAQLAVPHFGLPVSLAVIFAATGLSWCLVLATMAGMAAIRIEAAALVLLTAVAAFLVFLAGGAGTPLAALLLAPALEAWWLRGTKRSARTGAALSAVALAAVLAGTWAAGLPHAEPSAWHWLVPALYGASLWLRREWVFPVAGREPDLAPAQVDPFVLMDDEGVVTQVLGPRQAAWERLAGRPLVDSINVADRVSFLCALADARKTGAEAKVEVRLAGSGQDGLAGCHELTIVPLDADKIRVAFRDRSQEAALREELAAIRDDARSTEQAKSRFLATMSHELRTPLNAIIGFSEVLESEMLGKFAEPRQKEYVELIRQSGTHLLSIVNSILDVSKIEAGTYKLYPERFDLDEVAQLAISMVQPQAVAKSITLAKEADAAVGDVFLDRRAVLQMMLNLLSNAVKFTPAGGQVEIGLARRGNRVRVSVSDNGIGIAGPDLARIGNPFVQVENDYARHHDGTGLGLSLVKGLVALHNGEMSMESAPGEGTEVVLTFPTPPQAEIRKIGEQSQPRTHDDRKTKNDEILRKTA